MKLTLADDRPPIPPADLILRIATSFDPQSIETAKASFDLSGFEHLRTFERSLALLESEFSDFKRVLDFGCGCGRFLRHVGPLAGQTEFHGTDIDAEMIAWCAAQMPYAAFAVAPHEPPLPYPEHHFDLILNHSVFTHLNERYQDVWLAELQRITSAGALLLLTVEGASSWNRTCEAGERAGEHVERWRSELETGGILFIADDQLLGSTHPDFYHSAVHAPWYIFEHWTKFFDIAAYIPDGSLTQDLIILRRRPDGSPRLRPIGHRDPVPAAAQPVEPPAAVEHPSVRPTSSQLILRAKAAIERRLGKRVPLTPGEAAPVAPAVTSDTLDVEAITRELNMMRVGLYEQGNRISLIAAELRAELDQLKPSE